jgi:hypothetical protein
MKRERKQKERETGKRRQTFKTCFLNALSFTSIGPSLI